MSNDIILRDPVIQRLMSVSTTLTEAKTIQQTKVVVDVAIAAEVYARRQKLGNDAMAIALSIKAEALRKMGGYLQASARAAGNKFSDSHKYDKYADKHEYNESHGGYTEKPPCETPTLEQLGIDKRTSMIAQRLAALDENEFEMVRTGILTMSAAVAAKRAEHNDKEKTKKPHDDSQNGTSSESEAEERENAQGDLVKELEIAEKRINELSLLVDRLSSDDQARQIVDLTTRYAQLEGRLQQEIRTCQIAKEQATYGTKLLNAIRAELKVQKNSLIIPRLQLLIGKNDG